MHDCISALCYRTCISNAERNSPFVTTGSIFDSLRQACLRRVFQKYCMMQNDSIIIQTLAKPDILAHDPIVWIA